MGEPVVVLVTVGDLLLLVGLELKPVSGIRRLDGSAADGDDETM